VRSRGFSQALGTSGASGVTGTGSSSFGAGTIGVVGNNAQIGRIIGRNG
jgi:hypothetical protein